MNETIQTILTRTSTRSFKETSIKDEDLNTILNAAINAPSGMNQQLCEAFAITNTDLIEELNQAMIEAFRLRNESRDNYHVSYHAPVLIIVSGPEYDPRRIEDGSCMLENIFLAATSLNLGTVWINQLKDVQEVDCVKAVLDKIGFPENHIVVGCSALGYIDKPTPIKEKKQERIHIIK